MKYSFYMPFVRCFRFLVLLLLSGVMLLGCVGDENKDCLTGVFLRFSYIHNSDYIDLFSEQVNQLLVCVYSPSSEAPVWTGMVSRSELDASGRLYLPLTTGDYQIMVWGNADRSYYNWDESLSLSSFYMHVLCNNQMEVAPSLGSLFYGRADLPREEYQWGGEIPIELIKDTNRIRVVLQQKSASSSQGIPVYSAAISGSNGSYDSDNNSVAESPLQYIPRYMPLANGWEAEFTVLRLFEQDDMTLTLGWNDNGHTETFPLVEELMKHPDINNNDDLDRFDEYTLTYSMDDSSMQINLVGINDWSVSDVGGGI